MLKLTDFIIDCPDPMALAAFYAAVTGRPIREGSHDQWAGIEFGEVELAFYRVDDFTPPSWPDGAHPKQYHLDFEVDAFEAERERVIALGATLKESTINDEGYGWEVFTDPVGHPFCLCRNKGHVW